MIGIHCSDIDLVWARIEPLVKASIIKAHETELDVETIKAKLINRDMQLWVTDDHAGCLITTIVADKSKKLFAVVVAGINMDEWIDDVDETLIAFGKENGCKYIESCSRRGFHKTMKNHGYKVAHVVYRKELS